MTTFLQLGASLYVPSTRDDLAAVANRQKFPHLRSVIFCTEDAVRPEEVPRGLRHLEAALRRFEPVGLLRFVRVRNPDVLRCVLAMDHADRLAGFVLPKVTRHNLPEYAELLDAAPGFWVMPTLETPEAFDAQEMAALRDLLLRPRLRPRVLSLRVGGNDLLQLLGLRRPRRATLYDTPLGATVAQLVATFRPHGFNLTAPVFEWLGRRRLLAREVRQDLAHGLFGKSAIHPDQVPVIERCYWVRPRDLEMAERVLDPAAPAVFRWGGVMCEPATHRQWAALVRERARLYGVVGGAREAVR